MLFSRGAHESICCYTLKPQLRDLHQNCFPWHCAILQSDIVSKWQCFRNVHCSLRNEYHSLQRKTYCTRMWHTCPKSLLQVTLLVFANVLFVCPICLTCLYEKGRLTRSTAKPLSRVFAARKLWWADSDSLQHTFIIDGHHLHSHLQLKCHQQERCKFEHSLPQCTVCTLTFIKFSRGYTRIMAPSFQTITFTVKPHYNEFGGGAVIASL